ncbi:hypothetical protein PN36_18040 [Candidatus Thiomargarita nelsonii]|uniref:Uncharacterized protein n=1 Tax=Candidatus Thiomargarita nelsonii TaxID=1003181 RepID=A0A0A6P4D4_9GAMM|nr:hypothetical protein PN36_18040 [Candidatus Thiomargarita nelsonii]
MNNTKNKNYLYSVIVIIVTTLIAVFTNRFLYADGSHFFYKILFQQDFFAFDQARLYAQYITQAPTIFAVKLLGFENKNLLMFIYGSTLYGIPLLSIILTVVLLENKKLLSIPLLSFFISSIYSYSFIISEAHVMSSLFWILLVLIARTEHNFIHKTGIIILLIASTRLYESFMLFSILLFMLVAYKIKVENFIKNSIFWFVCLWLIIYGFSIALESYIHPRDSVNAGQFTNALISIFKESKNFWITILIFGLAFITSKRKENIWLLFILFVVVLGLVFNYPKYMEIGLSHSGRTLLTVVPLFFGFLFVIATIWCTQLSVLINNIHHRSETALTYVAVFFLALQIAITLQWYSYTQIFKTALHNNAKNPVVDYRETVLGKYLISNQMISGFGWGWTYPFMSFALSENRIFTVIENKNNRCCMPNQLITKMTHKKLIAFDSKKVIFSGFSKAEKTHRWSLGKYSTIQFFLEKSNDIQGKFILRLGTLGEQIIKITINGNYIGSQKANSWDTVLKFKFEPKILNQGSINLIHFEFPNAHKPNNGDQRVLAMAIKSFRIF